MTMFVRAASIATLAAVLLSLGACLQTAPPPVDPYLGLLPAGQTVTAAPQGFPIAAKGKSVGIVLSVSTEKQMEFLDKLVKQIKANPMYVYRADYEEASQPQFIITSIVNKLKQHFGRTEILQDFRGVAASKVDYVALIDLAVEMPREFRYYYQYDLKVDILNSALQRIGTLKGFGHESYYCIPIDCALATQLKSMKRAVAEFDAAADAALR
ncbi:hypothetical protein SAMN02990966_01877 [Rhodospirillales bacterium URHD0017]|nr:hypothetical protein SAMN02990966_01877 [Rhodospirillales bacterium URHD0017]